MAGRICVWFLCQAAPMVDCVFETFVLVCAERVTQTLTLDPQLWA